MDDVVTTTGPVHISVYGLPGYRFDLVHGVAVGSLLISTIVSTTVLLYLVRPIKTFFERPIGDRLVVYLAICDLCFSISHTLDHAYMLATENHPPDPVCIYFAFFVNQFILTQALMVIFTATNAFTMVVLNKRIRTGRYDWRLLAYALGIPVFLGTLGTSTGHLGPSGAWCWIDMRKPLGPVLSTAAAMFIVVAFLFNIICYAGVWFKIRQVALATASKQASQRYINSAKVMMLFVAAYIVQWWAFVAFGLNGLFGEPHVALFVAAVFFGNFGGVFNLFAYTFIRKNARTRPAGETGSGGNSQQAEERKVKPESTDAGMTSGDTAVTTINARGPAKGQDGGPTPVSELSEGTGESANNTANPV